MNKLTNLFLFATILSLSSCARSCESINKDFQSGDRTYEIYMYSGGRVIFHDKFRGIINNSEHSDGCYYSKGDTLIEISGDYTVKSID